MKVEPTSSLLSCSWTGANVLYLVDPACSDMLVLKAKPWMCRPKPPHGEAKGSIMF